MTEAESSSSRSDVPFRLGEWEVTPSLNRLRAGTQTASLEPRHMDLLVYLAAQPGEVRGKEEILAAVWPQQFVADSVLTRAIAELRSALGDDAHDPRFIETIPKRGYRLIAPVSRAGGSSGVLKAVVMVGVAATVLWSLAMVLTSLNEPDDPRRNGDSGRRPIAYQLTDSPAVEVFPDFSPDGTSLAYSSNASGSFEIWVRQLVAGGATTRITTDGEVNLEPVWSPDGAWIAYHSVVRGGIWRVPSRGGEPRRVSSFGSSPAWSPDSSEIVFRSATPSGLANSKAMPPSTLWRIDLDGGEPEPLTVPGVPIGGHGSPSYTPDGRFIVFQSGDFGIPGGLWSLSLDDGRLRRVGEMRNARFPIVDPGGRSIYFRARYRSQMWIHRIDLERDGHFGEPLRILHDQGLHLAISPDGRRLATSRIAESSHLWSIPVDPQSGERSGELEQLNDATNARNTLPAISPDGSQVAFQRFYAGRRPVIYILDLATREQREIVSGSLPSWSEDGRSLIFWGRGGLNRIDLATREIVNLAPWIENAGAVRLSPTADRLAFHRASEDGITNVWVSDLDGRNARQLTSDPEFAGFPFWSPDGSEIAFEIGRGGSTEIALLDLASGAIEQLTEESGLSWPEGWSPDGARIAFAGLRDGVWNIYQVSRSTRKVSRLTDYETGMETFARWPAWSPAGDRVVFERFQASSDLWLIDLR